jgi:hypothetical protein
MRSRRPRDRSGLRARSVAGQPGPAIPRSRPPSGPIPAPSNAARAAPDAPPSTPARHSSPAYPSGSSRAASVRWGRHAEPHSNRQSAARAFLRRNSGRQCSVRWEAASSKAAASTAHTQHNAHKYEGLPRIGGGLVSSAQTLSGSDASGRSDCTIAAAHRVGERRVYGVSILLGTADRKSALRTDLSCYTVPTGAT